MSKLLVINSDQLVDNGLFGCLVAAGFDLAEALNSIEGLGLAIDGLPDLILYAMDTSGLDAFEFLGSLRDHPATASIPLIVVTANPDLAHMRKAMALGADDYLIRPFSPDELLAAIEARLQHYTSYREMQTHLAAVRETEQLKTDMIRIAAHDLRNPLNAVGAALTLMRRRYGVRVS